MADIIVPYTRVLLDTTSVITTGQVNGTAFAWPADIDYGTFYFDFAYTSGATTLDVAIEVSPDGGTTWFKRIAPTQFATTSIKYAIDHNFSHHTVGAIATVTQNSTTLLTGALVADCPFPKDVRVSYQGGGTQVVTIKVWFVGRRHVKKAF